MQFVAGHGAGDRRRVGEHLLRRRGRGVGDAIGLECGALDLRLKLLAAGGRFGGGNLAGIGRLLLFLDLDLCRGDGGGQMHPRFTGQ